MSSLVFNQPLMHNRTASVSRGGRTGTSARSLTSLVCLSIMVAVLLAPYAPNRPAQTTEELANPVANRPAAVPPNPNRPRKVETLAPTIGAALLRISGWFMAPWYEYRPNPPVMPIKTPPAIAPNPIPAIFQDLLLSASCSLTRSACFWASLTTASGFLSVEMILPSFKVPRDDKNARVRAEYPLDEVM